LAAQAKAKLPWGQMALALVMGNRLWWARQKKKAEFADAFVHEVIVPSGPDGRPGERLLATSRSMYPPTIATDGSRCDFRVVVGNGGSTFAAVCLGRLADRGDAWRAAEDWATGKGEFPASPVVEDEAAGRPAFRYRVSLPSGKSLTEWQFEQGGWRFVAGLLCVPEDDELDMAGRSRQILSSWRWIDA
jgi:hypothetical protein